MYGDGVRLMEIYSCIKGLSVKVTRAPVSRKNTALAHSARHDVVASKVNAQRRCALTGEIPVQRAFPCQKFYVPSALWPGCFQHHVGGMPLEELKQTCQVIFSPPHGSK